MREDVAKGGRPLHIWYNNKSWELNLSQLGRPHVPEDIYPELISVQAQSTWKSIPGVKV